MTVSEQIVTDIIIDLEGRKGLGDEWDQIDDEVQEEIKQRWVNIVKYHRGWSKEEPCSNRS